MKPADESSVQSLSIERFVLVLNVINEAMLMKERTGPTEHAIYQITPPSFAIAYTKSKVRQDVVISSMHT